MNKLEGTVNKRVSYTSLCRRLGVKWCQIYEKQITFPLLILFRYCTQRLPAPARYLVTKLLPTCVWGSKFIDGPFYRYLVWQLKKIQSFAKFLSTFRCWALSLLEPIYIPYVGFTFITKLCMFVHWIFVQVHLISILVLAGKITSASD